MVGNESHFIVHDGGTSALGVDFREADPRPCKTMPGKRLRVRRRRWTGSSAAYEVVDEADALRWTSALMSRGGARRLWCRGEVYFAVGIEIGEYSGVLLWVPGWGWLGRVNLKLPKHPPTNHYP